LSERRELKWFPLYRGTESAGAATVPEIRVERRADGTVVSIQEGEHPAEASPALRGFILDASANQNAIRALELDWDAAAAPGVQQLSVEASDDLEHWRFWRRSAQLLRLEYRGAQLERRRIELPGEHAAYLRLAWESPETAPPHTAAVLIASRSTYRRPAIFWSDALAPTLTGDGDYVWQLPQTLAVERLRLDLSEANLLAPAELWGSEGRGETDQEHWRLPARPTLYRLLIEGKEWEQPEIELPGEPLQRIKLHLNRRGTGLGSGGPRLAVGATAQQMLFLARGPAPFRLVVGSGAAGAADLPAATLVPGYETAAAPPIAAARLGVLEPMTAPPPIPPSVLLSPGAFGWRTIALWAVMLAGVGFIGVTAFRLLRQAK
jgi:hypothetical protein